MTGTALPLVCTWVDGDLLQTLETVALGVNGISRLSTVALEEPFGLFSCEGVATLHSSYRSVQSGSLRLLSSTSSNSFLLINICLRQPNLSMPIACRSCSLSVSSTGPLMALALNRVVTSKGRGVPSSHRLTWSTVQSESCKGNIGCSISRSVFGLFPPSEVPGCSSVPPVPAPSVPVSRFSGDTSDDFCISLPALQSSALPPFAFTAAQFRAYWSHRLEFESSCKASIARRRRSGRESETDCKWLQ